GHALVRPLAIRAVPDRKQLRDLLAFEAHPACTGDEEEATGVVVVVVAVARRRARRRRQQPDPFVVANGRGREPDPPGELGDPHTVTVDLAFGCKVKRDQGLTLHSGAGRTVAARGPPRPRGRGAGDGNLHHRQHRARGRPRRTRTAAPRSGGWHGRRAR